jgi:hypothetical protein
MKTFNIYQHPTLGIEAVKQGFSWPGFLFGAIWMLVKKLWMLAALWFALGVALELVDMVAKSSTDEGAALLVQGLLLVGYLALMLVPGFKGNAWREAGLRRRGFVLKQTVQAETPDAALAQAAMAPGGLVMPAAQMPAQMPVQMPGQPQAQPA